MKTNSILTLFEGLNKQQAKEFTRRIYPALEAVRREILLHPSNPVQEERGREAQPSQQPFTSNNDSTNKEHHERIR